MSAGVEREKRPPTLGLVQLFPNDSPNQSGFQAAFHVGIFLFNRIPSSAPAHLFYSIIIVSGIFFNPVLWRLAC